MVPSYVIPLYWIALPIIVGQLWLGLCYSAAISYRLGIFILLKLGGVYCCQSYDALGAENQKRVSAHRGGRLLYVGYEAWRRHKKEHSYRVTIHG